MGATEAVAVGTDAVPVGDSVGQSVGVSKFGIVVRPGRKITWYGTHKSSPGKITVPRLQFARCNVGTVV
jgi:hypothetical protein